MRTIAVINQKGGVGKTTTAVNLSAALAEKGHSTLLIDMDPQAHASLHLGVELKTGEPSIYEVLCNQSSLAGARRQLEDHLYLVASHIDLAAAEMELVGVSGREVILRDKLAADAVDFEYVIMDCPPSLGMLTLNALAAAKEVILPMQPHFLALHGLSKLLQTLHLVQQRINPRLRLTGVVFCMYESGTRLASEVSGDVETFFQEAKGQAVPWCDARTFKTRIRRNIRVAEAPSFGRSIFNYAPACHGATDYGNLAEELIACAPAAARHRAAA